MRTAGWLLAVFLAALALRLPGLSSSPPTAAEAAFGLVAGGAGDALLLPRAIAALASALAATVLAAAFLGRGDRVLAGGAALLAVLDPLSAAAGREVGPGALLALVAALGVLAVLQPGRRPRLQLALIGLAVLGVIFLAVRGRQVIASVPQDAVFGAWREYLGAALAWAGVLVHHTGYALAPLAVAGLCRPNARRLALLLLLAAVLVWVADAGPPRRLTTLAAAGPILVAAALQIVGLVARLDREQARPPLAALGLIGLVLAINLPVLASDVAGGLRFPWRAALTRLDEVAPRSTPTLTTLPLVVAGLSDRSVGLLPGAPGALDALLDGDSPVVLLLPLEGGALHAAPSGLLERIEAAGVADFDVLARRFDLYRFEVRAFLLP